MSARLLHIRDLLAHGEALPPASAAWLVMSIDRLLAGDDPRAALNLDHAAGIRERNRLLIEGAAALHGSYWGKAVTLSKMVHRHQSGRSAPEWLVKAGRSARLPTTPRALYGIIRG